MMSSQNAVNERSDAILWKREQFAVSLRKKKTRSLINKKREAFLKHLTLQAGQPESAEVTQVLKRVEEALGHFFQEWEASNQTSSGKMVADLVLLSIRLAESDAELDGDQGFSQRGDFSTKFSEQVPQLANLISASIRAMSEDQREVIIDNSMAFSYTDGLLVIIINLASLLHFHCLSQAVLTTEVLEFCMAVEPKSKYYGWWAISNLLQASSEPSLITEESSTLILNRIGEVLAECFTAGDQLSKLEEEHLSSILSVLTKVALALCHLSSTCPSLAEQASIVFRDFAGSLRLLPESADTAKIALILLDAQGCFPVNEGVDIGGYLFSIVLHSDISGSDFEVLIQTPHLQKIANLNSQEVVNKMIGHVARLASEDELFVDKDLFAFLEMLNQALPAVFLAHPRLIDTIVNQVVFKFGVHQATPQSELAGKALCFFEGILEAANALYSNEEASTRVAERFLVESDMLEYFTDIWSESRGSSPCSSPSRFVLKATLKCLYKSLEQTYCAKNVVEALASWSIAKELLSQKTEIEENSFGQGCSFKNDDAINRQVELEMITTILNRYFEDEDQEESTMLEEEGIFSIQEERPSSNTEIVSEFNRIHF